MLSKTKKEIPTTGTVIRYGQRMFHLADEEIDLHPGELFDPHYNLFRIRIGLSLAYAQRLSQEQLRQYMLFFETLEATAKGGFIDSILFLSGALCLRARLALVTKEVKYDGIFYDIEIAPSDMKVKERYDKKSK